MLSTENFTPWVGCVPSKYSVWKMGIKKNIVCMSIKAPPKPTFHLVKEMCFCSARSTRGLFSAPRGCLSLWGERDPGLGLSSPPPSPWSGMSSQGSNESRASSFPARPREESSSSPPGHSALTLLHGESLVPTRPCFSWESAPHISTPGLLGVHYPSGWCSPPSREHRNLPPPLSPVLLRGDLLLGYL